MGQITDIIATARGGSTDRTASELLSQVVLAVGASGKKGTVTIKLEVSKLPGGDTEISIKPKLSFNAPVADLPISIHYPDEKGILHRENPRQLSMMDDDGKTIDLRARRMGASGDDL